MSTNHTSEEILAARLSHVDIETDTFYYHYKNPDLHYLVIDIALDEATEEPVVVYEASYGKRLTWVRSVKIWNELVEFEGQFVPRFSKVEKNKLTILCKKN